MLRTRRCRAGRRFTRCFATASATCSSITSVPVKTPSTPPSFVPTARTCRTSSERTLRSSWGFPSASRSAIEAARALRRGARRRSRRTRTRRRRTTEGHSGEELRHIPWCHGRQSRALRIGSDSLRRRELRLLPGPAHVGEPASGHDLRGSLRPCARHRQASPAEREARWSASRRRRATGRDGRAKAVLARQLPLRERAGARWPRMEALSSPVAARRQARSMGRRRHSNGAPITAMSPRSRATLGTEAFFDAMDDVLSPTTTRPAARDARGHRRARGADTYARRLGRQRAQLARDGTNASRHAGPRGALRDHRHVGGFLDTVT